MRQRKNIWRMAALLTAAVSAANLCLTEAKAMPVTEENILALLDEYDPDGAYILRESFSRRENVLGWFEKENDILADIDTAVHEETHRYTFRSHSLKQEDIYIGGQQHICVKYTNVFDSTEMSGEIPEELRTSRFDTYIGSPEQNLASNIDGIYGLLNEFNAYSWGMNTTVSLYDCYWSAAESPLDWDGYILQSCNDRQAYGDFNYYILKYLLYAQKHHPDIYRDIIANESFREAYQITEGRYRALIAKWEQQTAEIMERCHIEKASAYLFDDQYRRLINEISKPEYRAVYRLLCGTDMPDMRGTVQESDNAAEAANDSILMTANNVKTYNTITNDKDTDGGQDWWRSLLIIGGIVAGAVIFVLILTAIDNTWTDKMNSRTCK